MLRTALLTTLLAISLGTQAQVSYTIADGNITTCTGALLDSGGEGGPGYQNNENYTAVICPDNADDAISLQWIIFNLSINGVAPIDQITIYDGNSTSAPVIGTWSGSNSPGIVSASFANPTGCLTVNFTSNDFGQGFFAAAITCYQPCEPPTAVASVTGETVPILACQGEVLTFDASASYAAQNFTIVDHSWNFDDGTTGSGAVVQHSFDEPGEYVVQVTLTDDNGCVNANLVDLQVFVSTTPLFTGTSPSTTICQGQSVPLNAVATPVQWSALPESNLGDGLFLPDLQGVPFFTSITFTEFAPGATLTNVNDLLSVCVDMEHSFIGDLVISLTCPSGQSVDFHQQGGGATFLGIPVDDDAQPEAQGTCWNYCWSPMATNGTWEANSGVETLPSATYQSEEPFGNLLGCPLNGAWTFTVTDFWASDNGFLCNWTIGFDPDLFPDLTQFTPVLGVASADSSQWTGNSFAANPNNPLQGVATPELPGQFPYVFSVIDNFGCTYDTTITITVLPAPQGPIEISGPPPCSGSPITLSAPAGYDSYVWSPGGATGQSIQVTSSGSFSVTVGLGVCTLPSDPFLAQVGIQPDASFIGNPLSPVNPGVPIAFTNQTVPLGPNVSWDWDFGDMIGSSTTQDPSYTYNVPGEYTTTLIATAPGPCSDTAYVTYVVRPEEIRPINVFSPNNDGVNDAFVVENLQYYKNNVTIYSRWGNVVFEAKDYRNTWRASEISDGTYFYEIVLTEDGRKYTGHVTILR